MLISSELYRFVDFIEMKDEEKRTVLQWRNHMSIRQWMYNTNIIEWEDHLKFLNGLKNDPTKKYWLVKRENKDIGVSSIVDIDDKSGEWGYYLAPDLHGTNLGVEFYLFTLNFLFNIVGMEFLKGYAAVKNKGANSFNDLFGFSKKPVTKIIDKKSTEFFYRELSVDTFNNKIVNDQKIERLLKLTLTNI